MALAAVGRPARTEAESRATEKVRLAQFGLLVRGENGIEGSIRFILDG